MPRTTDAVFLERYLTDAVRDDVAKHGSHNQKSHGRRTRRGGKEYGPGGRYGAVSGAGKKPVIGTSLTSGRQRVQVHMDPGERAGRAAVGLGVGAISGLMAPGWGAVGVQLTGSSMIAQAIRGKKFVDVESPRGRRALGKAAKQRSVPDAVATRLRAAYEQWLSAVDRPDTDEAVREYAGLVAREAARRRD